MPLGSYGGTSDPQPEGSERVRSRRNTLPIYDKQMVPPGQFGSPEAEAWVKKIQRNNANRVEDDALATWAQGQVTAWQQYVKTRSLSMPISLTEWLDCNWAADNGGSADFLERLDAIRSKKAQDGIDASDAKYEATKRSGYAQPGPKGRSEDIDAAEGRTSPAGPPSDAERAVQSFRAEHGQWVEVERWCRSQMKAYREYLRAFGRSSLAERLTPEQWLKVNFRAAREGGSR
jgi:hypothetical protein